MLDSLQGPLKQPRHGNRLVPALLCGSNSFVASVPIVRRFAAKLTTTRKTYLLTSHKRQQMLLFCLSSNMSMVASTPSWVLSADIRQGSHTAAPSLNGSRLRDIAQVHNTKNMQPCTGMLPSNMLLPLLGGCKAQIAGSHSALSVTSAATCSTFCPQPRAFPLSGFCREAGFMRHHLSVGKRQQWHCCCTTVTTVQHINCFSAQCLKPTLVPARTLIPLELSS